MKRWIAWFAALFLFMGGAAVNAQSYIGRPLTSYTLYATGTSFTDPFSIGGRLNTSAAGTMVLRLVAPLSFHFLISPSRAAGITATLSHYFLPGNEVGYFRVPWGNFLAVISPLGVLTSETSRVTINVVEME